MLTTRIKQKGKHNNDVYETKYKTTKKSLVINDKKEGISVELIIFLISSVARGKLTNSSVTSIG